MLIEPIWQCSLNTSDIQRVLEAEELDGQAEPSGKLPVNKEPMWIGARPGGVAATGIIDEVRFYDRALSEEQIKALFNSQM